MSRRSPRWDPSAITGESFQAAPRCCDTRLCAATRSQPASSGPGASTQAWAEHTVTMKPAHLNTTMAGFESNSGTDSDDDGWFFAAPPVGETTIVSLTAHLDTGDITVSHREGHPGQVTVSTPDGTTLQGAEATVIGPATELNRSHTCPGGGNSALRLRP